MTTYRQFGRGVMRTVRAIDRANRRSQRQQQAHLKAVTKQLILAASADAVADYDALIAALTGAHRVRFERRDWKGLAAAPRVPDPVFRSDAEAAAQAALQGYRPGWLARLFRSDKRRRAKLVAAIEVARQSDAAGFLAEQAQAKKRNAEIEFGGQLLAGDPEAVTEALQRYAAFEELPFSVEGIDLIFTDGGRIIAMVDGLDLEDMPTQSVTLLASGKASTKALSKGRILELHRDAICSAAIRVGIEMLQALPLDAVEVVMHTDLLDRGTGHIRGEPVLHVQIAAQALAGLNLALAEGTAIVERLGGSFNWTKRDGFRKIDLKALGIPTDLAQAAGD